MKQINKKRLAERFNYFLRHLYFRNLMLLLIALVAFGFTYKVDCWQSAEEQDWVLLQEEEGIKAYYQFSSCDNGSSVMLKFNNTNNNDVVAAWSLKVLVSGEYFTLDINSLPLKAGEILEGNCLDERFPVLLINLHELKDQGVGEDLSFVDFKIIKIN